MIWLAVSSMQAIWWPLRVIYAFWISKNGHRDDKKVARETGTFLSTFYPFPTPLSLWCCFAHDGTLLSHWFITLKHKYEWSISILTMFVCMFTHRLIFSFFSTHFVIHQCPSSLLFDTATLWLLIIPCVHIMYQPLGSLEESTGILFHITVYRSMWCVWWNMSIMSLFHSSSW